MPCSNRCPQRPVNISEKVLWLMCSQRENLIIYRLAKKIADFAGLCEVSANLYKISLKHIPLTICCGKPTLTTTYDFTLALNCCILCCKTDIQWFGLNSTGRENTAAIHITIYLGLLQVRRGYFRICQCVLGSLAIGGNY